MINLCRDFLVDSTLCTFSLFQTKGRKKTHKIKVKNIKKDGIHFNTLRMMHTTYKDKKDIFEWQLYSIVSEIKFNE